MRLNRFPNPEKWKPSGGLPVTLTLSLNITPASKKWNRGPSSPPWNNYWVPWGGGGDFCLPNSDDKKAQLFGKGISKWKKMGKNTPTKKSYCKKRNFSSSVYNRFPAEIRKHREKQIKTAKSSPNQNAK